jgi:hypothetical protein
MPPPKSHCRPPLALNVAALSQCCYPTVNVAWDSLQWRPYRRPKYGVVQIYKEVIVVNGRHYRFKCRRVSTTASVLKHELGWHWLGWHNVCPSQMG